MSNIDKRALRKAAMHAKTEDDWGCDADNFHDKATPDAVLALMDELEAAEKRITDCHTVLNNLAAVARRYLPDYDEHPDIQAADDLLEIAAGIGVKGEI